MLNRAIKTFAITAAVTVLALPFLGSSSAAALKLRYITSVYSDDKDISLEQPEGVACNKNSVFFVADTGNGRLLRYAFKKGILDKGASVIKQDQVSYPTRIAMNSKGEMYVLDRKQRLIIHLNSAGRFKAELRPTGLPSPASYVPRSLAVDMVDNIYILDIFSQRVLVLNPEGRYINHITFPEKYGFFSDVTVDFKGTVLLVDSVNGMVFSAGRNSESFSPLTGSLKEYVRFPANLTTDSKGRIYVLDRNGGSIIILGQDGSLLGRQSGLGWKEGRLNFPAQMCINKKGQIFIADTRNNRVQIFELVE